MCDPGVVLGSGRLCFRHPADPRIALGVESVRPLDSLGYADSRPLSDLERATPLPRCADAELFAVERTPVFLQREAEGPGKSARSGSNGGSLDIRFEPSIHAHALDSKERFHRPDQDGRTGSFGFTDQIDAGVDSIARVRVEVPRWTKHASVPGGGASMGMGAGVAAVSPVGFHFNHSSGENQAIGCFSDQDAAK